MKKLLLTLGAAGATLAPLATVVACGSENNPTSEVVNGEILLNIKDVDETNYKVNSTNQVWWEIEKAEDGVIESVADLIVENIQSHEFEDEDTAKIAMYFGNVSNNQTMRLEIEQVDHEGKVVTFDDMSDAQLKAMVTLSLLEKSVERSEGTLQEINKTGMKLSEYWKARDTALTTSGLTVIDVSTFDWNSYEADKTFDIVQTAPVAITDDEDGTVSNIDGTSVDILSGVTVSSDLTITVLDWWRKDTGETIADGAGYEFRLDSEMLFQNIYLKLEITDETKADTHFVPSSHAELLEIIKEGNGISSEMEAKRAEYQAGIVTLGGTNENE